MNHVTHMVAILMSFFLFSFKTIVFIVVFLTFLILTICFYILVLYSVVYGKHKLGSSIIDQIGKTAFTVVFLSVANTLV